MSRLRDKVALVVGGSSGIGLAVAKRFALEGADLFITGRREADLQTAMHQIGDRIQTLRADASDLGDLERAFSAIRSERGRLDILVVNAGMSGHAPLGEVTEEHFDGIIGLNVRSLLFASQAAVGLMSTGSAIVLIGSIADTKGVSGYAVYAASKAAVRSLARTWANELAPRGIRVNVVSPGPIDTAMMAAVSDEMRDTLTKMIPMRRLGRPEEVAAAALFLGSDESSFVTGAELAVDGGLAQV